MRPRVAVVCQSVAEGGGVANVAIHQSRELGREFEVLLMSESFPAAPIAGVEYVPVQCRRYGWLRRFAHVPNLLGFVLAVRRELRRQPAVACIVVHSHLAGVLAAGSRGVPWALVPHGDIATRPPGTFDPLVTWLYRIVEPIAWRRATMIMAISEPLARTAVRNGAEPEAVRLIPNGIDLDQFVATPVVDRTPLPLLFIGRLSVEKGPDLLTAACALLRARGVPYHLDVVGDGPLHARLLAEAVDAGLQRDVEFHGRMAPDQVREFLRRAAVLCVPSRSDAQPLVVLEALASGVPVVGTDVEGIPSMVTDGQNGLLTAPDPTSLADALQRLHEDRDLLARLAGAARHSVERYSWAHIGSALRDAVRELIDR